MTAHRSMGYAPPATILGVGARIVFVMLAWAAVVYLLMAAVDYAHQYHEFMKKQRMSIDEVRREYKDNEERTPPLVGRNPCPAWRGCSLTLV